MLLLTTSIFCTKFCSVISIFFKIANINKLNLPSNRLTVWETSLLLGFLWLLSFCFLPLKLLILYSAILSAVFAFIASPKIAASCDRVEVVSDTPPVPTFWLNRVSEGLHTLEVLFDFKLFLNQLLLIVSPVCFHFRLKQRNLLLAELGMLFFNQDLLVSNWWVSLSQLRFFLESLQNLSLLASNLQFLLMS